MPQSQDKNGEYHDIAFPVMKGLRGQITEVVLESYNKAIDRIASKEKNFSGRIAAGKEKSNDYKQKTAQQPQPQKSYAKRAAR